MSCRGVLDSGPQRHLGFFPYLSLPFPSLTSLSLSSLADSDRENSSAW